MGLKTTKGRLADDHGTGLTARPAVLLWLLLCV